MGWAIPIRRVRFPSTSANASTVVRGRAFSANAKRGSTTAKNYSELPGLEQVYLEDSWVLDVAIGRGTVSVSLDVVLCEDHHEYATPPGHERYCYRRGVLRFSDVTEVRWQMPTGPPAIDATGETDYGGVDEYLFEKTTHSLAGSFGELVVNCRAHSLELEPPPSS